MGGNGEHGASCYLTVHDSGLSIDKAHPQVLRILVALLFTLFSILVSTMTFYFDLCIRVADS